MSENEKQSFSPETQKQRWVKYGSNVILTIVVVIAIAGIMIYLAQRAHRILDTRAGSSNALKPQTLNLIQDLQPKIKIVSLYSAQGESGETQAEKKSRLERKQAVEDLLNDYKRYGKNIDVDFIDPDASPAKADGLVKEVTTQYGGEVAKYKGFLDGYEAQRKKLKDLTDAETKAVSALPVEKAQDAELKKTLILIVYTVEGVGELLDRQKESIDRLLKQQPPDYKGATDRVRSSMDDFSTQVNLIIDRLNDAKQNAATPDEFKKYATDSAPRYQAIKQLADSIVKQIDSLGDLKLDQLRQSLKDRDSLLVMGPSDLKVIPYDKVWRTDDQTQIKAYLTNNTEIKPTFAGEQQISTAILSLTRSSKPKVVFIRPGGAPLATPGNPFQRGGPLSDIADRLRDYNFDVVEKDISGQYAMQAQMQGQPAPPEPSDDDIKDAIWVMLPLPSGQQGQPPTDMAPKLAEHLKSGGAAMVMLFPQSDDLATATKDYGIEGNASAIVVHEEVRANQGAAGDQLDEARRLQFVFDIRNYGDHEITHPLRSLQSWLVPLLPVKTSAAKDCTVTPLVPVPNDPKSWATSNIDALEKHDVVKFDESKGDIPGPLNGMAASESKNGARLVEIGCPVFVFNSYLEEPDPDLARQGLFVSRFPANAELFMNSIYWLAKEDTMIAISPAAMQIPRIKDIPDGPLSMWRNGFLLIILPGLAIIAGIGVYFSRRD
jgi:ABC-type uncharacterized transport system